MTPPSPIMSPEEHRAVLAREARRLQASTERFVAIIGGGIVLCLLAASALLALAVVVWAGKLLWRVAVGG